jgi:phenylpropionate dioxygenase-like ring-hydroxylating dioxygenase large terminal subunit
MSTQIESRPEARLPDWNNTRPVRDRYPEVDTSPIPIEAYVSDEFFELEREKIFKKTWLYAGRMERLQKPGDYFVTTMEVLRTKKDGTYPSFIVTRDDNGEVRAFYNACQHRGTKVCWEDTNTWASSNRKYFTCRFHGWVYGSDGALKHVPDEDQFFDLNKAERGLAPVHCAVWKDFIFINVDPSPRQSLEEQIAPHAATLKDFPFERLRKTGIWTATMNVNWKVALDAFQEGYHVATVHAGTIPNAFNGSLNPYCRPTSVRLYEEGNRSVTFMVSPEYQPDELEMWVLKRGSNWYAPAEGTGENEFPGANPENDPFYAFDCHGFFPNLLVDPFMGGYYGHEFWPIETNKTRWVGSINFLEPQKPSDLLANEHGKILLRDAFREDTVTLDASQEGLESGGLKDVVFCDHEMAPRHLVNRVMEIVNS